MCALRYESEVKFRRRYFKVASLHYDKLPISSSELIDPQRNTLETFSSLISAPVQILAHYNTILQLPCIGLYAMSSCVNPVDHVIDVMLKGFCNLID